MLNLFCNGLLIKWFGILWHSVDADMEDYGFEYSEEEPEEQDVDIENQYYNSKGTSVAYNFLFENSLEVLSILEKFSECFKIFFRNFRKINCAKRRVFLLFVIKVKNFRVWAIAVFSFYAKYGSFYDCLLKKLRTIDLEVLQFRFLCQIWFLLWFLIWKIIYIYIYIYIEREREREREREKQIVIPLLKWYSLANKDDTSFHRQPLLPFSDHFHCHDRESENRTEPILSVWLLNCELGLFKLKLHIALSLLNWAQTPLNYTQNGFSGILLMCM